MADGRHQCVLEFIIRRLTGTEDIHEYCVEYESGPDTAGATPFVASEGRVAKFDHRQQLMLDVQPNHMLFQVIQRNADFDPDRRSLFPKWVQVDLPKVSSSWKTSDILLGKGLTLVLKVMMSTAAISEHSFGPPSAVVPSVAGDVPDDAEPASPLMTQPVQQKAKPSCLGTLVAKNPDMLITMLKRFVQMFGGMGNSGGKTRKKALGIKEFRKWIDSCDISHAKLDPNKCFKEIDTDDSEELTPMEIIAYMYNVAKEIGEKEKKDAPVQRRLEICICFLMFASQPDGVSKKEGPVLTMDDLVYMMYNMLSCTTYYSRNTIETKAQEQALQMLEKYATKEIKPTEGEPKIKYLDLQDFEKMMDDDTNPDLGTMLQMWKHLADFETSMKTEHRVCYMGGPVRFWPNCLVADACSRPSSEVPEGDTCVVL